MPSMSNIAAWRQTRARARVLRLIRRVLPVLLLAPLLAGCADPVDSEQLRLCRQVIPAVNAEGTEISELRHGLLLGQPGVRIDYAARAPGQASSSRYLECVFAGRTFSADRLGLVAVQTDSGPLGDARLYYLKRFWLGSPEAAADKGSDFPAVPVLPSSLAYLAQLLINALA